LIRSKAEKRFLPRQPDGHVRRAHLRTKIPRDGCRRVVCDTTPARLRKQLTISTIGSGVERIHEAIIPNLRLVGVVSFDQIDGRGVQSNC
jgi:hypothetical protein